MSCRLHKSSTTCSSLLRDPGGEVLGEPAATCAISRGHGGKTALGPGEVKRRRRKQARRELEGTSILIQKLTV